MRVHLGTVLLAGAALAASVAPASADGVTERVSAAGKRQGNGDSFWSSMSADGRYVAFELNATNLVGPVATNGSSNVFVRDRVTGKVRLATIGAAARRRPTAGAPEHLGKRALRRLHVAVRQPALPRDHHGRWHLPAGP